MKNFLVQKRLIAKFLEKKKKDGIWCSETRYHVGITEHRVASFSERYVYGSSIRVVVLAFLCTMSHV